MAIQLPTRPSLRYLQEQAKDLLKSHGQGDARACDVLRAHPRFRKMPDEKILAAALSLQQVQHALALHYGFGAWKELRAHVEGRRTVDVTGELREKGNKRAERIAGLAGEDDAALDEVFEAVRSADKGTKNAAGKVLQILSAKVPTRVYPRLGRFVELLEGKDNILRWIATDAIGNVAGVDVEDKVDEQLVAKLAQLLSDDTMITAAHAVESLGKIALSKPQYRKTITTALLKPDTVDRQAECHNILAGKRIDAFARYVRLIDDREAILDFVRGHLSNSRNATRKRATRFIERVEGETRTKSLKKGLL